MIFVMYLVFFGFTLLSTALSKLISRSVTSGGDGARPLFLVINGITACIAFYVIGRFQISVNSRTLVYSAVFAIICITALLTNVAVYNYAAVSLVGVSRNSASVIFNTVLGGILFHEVIAVQGYIRIVLLLLAIFILFSGENEPKDDGQKKGGFTRRTATAIILISFLVFLGGAVSVISKLYASDNGVCDSNSFFFFTNLLIIVFASAWLFISCKRNSADVVAAAKALKIRDWLFITGNTVLSNVVSLLTIMILKSQDISLFTAITSSMAVLATVLVSVFFKEKVTIYSVIAAVLAGAAMFIS